MRHRGFDLTLGHSNWTICSLLSWFCCNFFPKVNETQGFLTMGHSNRTISSPLNWFCHEVFRSFCPLSHNNPILYTAEGRKEGAGSQFFLQLASGLKMGKGDCPKLNEILGLSNWTICSPLSWFCCKFFPLFYLLYWGLPILITPEREEGRLKMGKRESPKSEWDTGVSDLGAFKLDHLQPAKLILSQNLSTFFPSRP